MFNWGIRKIKFSGGEAVELEPSSVLILVGPNSGGKTSSIRGIEGQIYTPNNPKLTISEVELFVEGIEKDFLEWLSKYYHTRETVNGINYVTLQGTLLPRQITSTWAQIASNKQPGEAQSFLMKRLDTGTRLQLGDITGSLEYGSIEPRAFIHVLQSNEKLREQVSKEVRDNFGFDLIINWGGGGQVWFNVGTEPPRTVERDRVSHEYLAELNRLPRLEYEGDGIRSFVGTLLATLCAAYKIIFIDEPEVLLHPPQARRLANILARSASDFNRQVIIATHSSEVIHGVLDVNPRVTICRITREGAVNHASALKAPDIYELFTKPLLNSVAAIDGVFYDGTIICEADSDNRFYDAIVRYVVAQRSFRKPPYFYFIHGGGKGSLATLATTYRKLHVPVAVIADFDILRQKSQMESVIRALDGDFSSMETLYNVAIAALNNLPPLKDINSFIATTESTIRNIKDRNAISAEDRKTLYQVLDESKSWSEAKKYGITKLSGGAYNACEELLEKCAALGLFIVPTGELESWWRGGSASKSEWSNMALEKFYQNPLLFRDAIDFTTRIIAHLTD